MSGSNSDTLDPIDADRYDLEIDALLDQQARDRYDLSITQISQRLRLAEQHRDDATVTVCRRAMEFLTHDFRTYGVTPIFSPPGDLREDFKPDSEE